MNVCEYLISIKANNLSIYIYAMPSMYKKRAGQPSVARARAAATKRRVPRPVPQFAPSYSRPGSSQLTVYMRRLIDVYTTTVTGNAAIKINTADVVDQNEWSQFVAMYTSYRVKKITVTFVPAAPMVNAVEGADFPASTGNCWRIMSTNKVLTTAPTDDASYVESSTMSIVSPTKGWTKTWTNDMRSPRNNFVLTNSTSNIGGVFAYFDGEATAASSLCGTQIVTFIVEFNSQQ